MLLIKATYLPTYFFTYLLISGNESFQAIDYTKASWAPAALHFADAEACEASVIGWSWFSNVLGLHWHYDNQTHINQEKIYTKNKKTANNKEKPKSAGRKDGS